MTDAHSMAKPSNRVRKRTCRQAPSRPSSLSHSPAIKPDFAEAPAASVQRTPALSRLSKLPRLPGFTTCVKNKKSKIPDSTFVTQTSNFLHSTQTSNKCQHDTCKKRDDGHSRHADWRTQAQSTALPPRATPACDMGATCHKHLKLRDLQEGTSSPAARGGPATRAMRPGVEGTGNLSGEEGMGAAISGEARRGITAFEAQRGRPILGAVFASTPRVQPSS